MDYCMYPGGLIVRDHLSKTWPNGLETRLKHCSLNCMSQKHSATLTYDASPIIATMITIGLSLTFDLLAGVVNICSSKLLWELRQDAAACLGLLCTVLSYEAERIFKWLFLKLTSSGRDEVKLLYLVAAQRALEAAGERKAFSHVMQVTPYRGFCGFLYSSMVLLITVACTQNGAWMQCMPLPVTQKVYRIDRFVHCMCVCVCVPALLLVLECAIIMCWESSSTIIMHN